MTNNVSISTTVSTTVLFYTLSHNYCAFFSVSLLSKLKMHTENLRARILQERRQSQSIHPLVHALPTVSREVVSPHVRVFGLEGELLVDFVLGFADGNSVRR